MTGRNLAKLGLAMTALLLAWPAAAAVLDVTNGSAKLTWAAATGPVAGYGVFVSRNGGPFPASPDQMVTNPEVTLTGVPGDMLAVKVAAFDPAGVRGPDSPVSDSLSFLAAPAPSPTPQPASTVPAVSVSTSNLSATVVAGQNAPSQSFSIRNTGGGTLNYLLANSDGWFVVSTRGGTATTEIDSIGVSFATAALAPGSYTGTITVVQTDTPRTEKYITVSLSVTAAAPVIQPAAIGISPGALSMSVEKGKNAGALSFSVRNSGGGTLAYGVGSSASWVTVAPASGTSTGESDAIGVTFATSSLNPGTYTASLTVSGGAGVVPQIIPVSLAVTDLAPAIELSTAALGASVETGKLPSATGFAVRNAGGGTLGYSISSSASWLTVTPASGTSTGESDAIGVSFATASLRAGTYPATLTVSGPAGVAPKTIAVSVTVKDPAPSLAVSTTSLAATAQKGQKAPAASFTIRNAGGGTLQYAVSAGASWLSLSPASGTSTGESDAIAVGYATAGLAPGSYSDVITVSGIGVATRTIAVSLTVSPGTPVLELSTASLDVVATPGRDPASQSFTVRNAGEGTLDYAVSADQSWVTVSPTRGTSTGEADPLTLRFSTTGLQPGTQRAVVTVSATGLPPKTITVSLRLVARVARSDSNGDGRSDLLFRHADGAVSGWLMAGDRLGAGISPPSMGTSWTLAGTGDFDGDGKSFDFLWLDPSSGNVVIATNDGGTQRGLASLGAVGGTSQLAGVADFDGDGKSDVLWLDPASGSLTIWLLDGFAQKAARPVGTIGVGWSVAATGDFDGDRKADVLFQKLGTQQRLLWLLDGTTVRQSVAPGLPLGSDFNVIGAGDFDGDGRQDLAAYYPSYGIVSLLLSRGTSFVQSTVYAWVTSTARLATTGDADGDGKDDLFFADPGTGVVSVWLLDQYWIRKTAALVGLDPTWTAIGQKGTVR